MPDGERQSKDHLKALRLLGLAFRAGQVAIGLPAIEKSISQGQAFLLWLADDTGPSSRTKLLQLASSSRLPVVEQVTKAELAHWTGKTSCAAVVIKQESLASQIQHLVAGQK